MVKNRTDKIYMFNGYVKNKPMATAIKTVVFVLLKSS